MTEAEIEDVLMTLPAIHHRANVLSYFFRLREQIRRLASGTHAAPPEAPPPVEPPPATVVVETVVVSDAAAIAAWIRDTNAADTVRANYARKLADRIEAGEYRKTEGVTEEAGDVLA